MKRSGLFIPTLAVLAYTSVIAHGGIARTGYDATTPRQDGTRVHSASHDRDASFDWTSNRLPGEPNEWQLADTLPPTTDDEPTDESSLGTPQVLTRTPSSLLLGLTALAGVGLYHAGQSIRRVQAPLVADWYHTGGPQQIGHATPLDLDTLDLPPCVLDPLAHVPDCTTRFAFEADLRIPSEDLPHTTAPRGPPAISSFR